MKSYTERQAEIDRKVAQELKNNHDFICTTNQWLQKLDTALEKIKKEMTVHADDVGSKIKTQDISIENLTSRNESHKKSCNADLDEYRKQMSFCLQFMKEGIRRSDERFSILEDCSSTLHELKDRMDAMASEIQRLDQLVSIEVIRLSTKIEERSKSLKEEITNLPSEVPALKQSIVDQIKIFQVDFVGLSHEIEKIKKRAFVSSKHIEDLYTRLEKLKQVKQ